MHVFGVPSKVKHRWKGLLFYFLVTLACSVDVWAAGEDLSLKETAAEESVVAERPERVIALSKSNAELWILAGGTLIAASDDAMGVEGMNPDVQNLGDMDHVSLEAVAALEPELLILFSTEPAQKALGEAAEGIGIPVSGQNIDDFEDYAAAMRFFTWLTGREDLYQKHVENVRDEIREAIRTAPGELKGKTFLLLHVSATKSKVEKNDYFASEIFSDFGLVNIADDDSSLNDLSLEAIVAVDPDYIFVVPRGDEEKALESFKTLFSSEPAWESLSAVRDGHYVLLSKELFGLKPNARWGEAYRQAVIWLQELS